MSMNWNHVVRQAHRWLSIAFTVAVIVNIVAIVASGEEPPPIWVGLLALVPLVFLLISGLYLFVLPYATKRRRGSRAGGPVLE